MKILFVLFFSMSSILTTAQIEMFQNLYFQATNEEGIKKFYQTLSIHKANTDIEKAYKGVAIAMFASLADGVKAKFSYFESGKKLIEDAVSADPNNAEIRFLRFSVQAEIPWILGYSSNLENDANLVINAAEKKTINPSSDYWKKALKYLKNSEAITTEQRKRLEKLA